MKFLTFILSVVIIISSLSIAVFSIDSNSRVVKLYSTVPLGYFIMYKLHDKYFNPDVNTDSFPAYLKDVLGADPTYKDSIFGIWYDQDSKSYYYSDTNGNTFDSVSKFYDRLFGWYTSCEVFYQYFERRYSFEGHLLFWGGSTAGGHRPCVRPGVEIIDVSNRYVMYNDSHTLYIHYDLQGYDDCILYQRENGSIYIMTEDEFEALFDSYNIKEDPSFAKELYSKQVRGLYLEDYADISKYEITEIHECDHEIVSPPDTSTEPESPEESDTPAEPDSSNFPESPEESGTKPSDSTDDGSVYEIVIAAAAGAIVAAAVTSTAFIFARKKKNK